MERETQKVIVIVSQLATTMTYNISLHIVESEEMVSIEDKRAFCVLYYHVHSTVIEEFVGKKASVTKMDSEKTPRKGNNIFCLQAPQLVFNGILRFGEDPPSDPSICKWYSDFKKRRCIRTVRGNLLDARQ
ncbi:hypothetical protein C0J52_11715 [Blattella germanica]|nr:hypothetical protein C0J52_11715 [Blattella germanica]